MQVLVIQEPVTSDVKHENAAAQAQQELPTIVQALVIQEPVTSDVKHENAAAQAQQEHNYRR